MPIRFALPFQGEIVVCFNPPRCGGLLRIALAGRKKTYNPTENTIPTLVYFNRVILTGK
jgi:hypothetical protein